MSNNGSPVRFSEEKLNEVLNYKLKIPPYQRNYCWEEHHVRTLLNDLLAIKTESYFLGTIILHEKNDQEDNNVIYDIIDGQQRLITLGILRYRIYGENCSLLEEKLLSNNALYRIQENDSIIKSFLQVNGHTDALKAALEKVKFGVLVVNNDHLDLAFTFFTNTNSRGVPLTDYDLLKPHHLRYISSDFPEQQQLLAEEWDRMISAGRKLSDSPDKRRDADYIRVIELYLFRLRKWSRNKECIENGKFIYNEFKSASVIDEIPPFGERFNYYEPIQGGQHFFEYVDHFMQKYHEFTTTGKIDPETGKPNPVSEVLKDYFSGYSDKWYRYVIEALVFAYYLKFGTRFIEEATLTIIRYISQIRFEKGRAYEPTIVRFANDSGIPIIIEQSSSPTFFLAEMESLINGLNGINIGDKGIRNYFLRCCEGATNVLSNRCDTKYFKDYFKTRYGSIKTQ